MKPTFKDTIDEFVVTFVESYAEAGQLFAASEAPVADIAATISRWATYIIEHCEQPELQSSFMSSIYEHILKDRMTPLQIHWAHASFGKVLANKLNESMKASVYHQWRLFISNIAREFLSFYGKGATPRPAEEQHAAYPLKLQLAPAVAESDDAELSHEPDVNIPSEEVREVTPVNEPQDEQNQPEEFQADATENGITAPLADDPSVSERETLPQDARQEESVPVIKVTLPPMSLPESVRQEIRKMIKSEIERLIHEEIHQAIQQELQELSKPDALERFLKKTS
jgi:hypothetical protein